MIVLPSMVAGTKEATSFDLEQIKGSVLSITLA